MACSLLGSFLHFIDLGIVGSMVVECLPALPHERHGDPGQMRPHYDRRQGRGRLGEVNGKDGVVRLYSLSGDSL